MRLLKSASLGVPANVAGGVPLRGAGDHLIPQHWPGRRCRWGALHTRDDSSLSVYRPAQLHLPGGPLENPRCRRLFLRGDSHTPACSASCERSSICTETSAKSTKSVTPNPPRPFPLLHPVSPAAMLIRILMMIKIVKMMKSVKRMTMKANVNRSMPHLHHRLRLVGRSGRGRGTRSWRVRGPRLPRISSGES